MSAEKDPEKDSTNLPSLVAEQGYLSAPSHWSGLANYLRKVNSFPSLSEEEEFLLAKSHIEKGDVEAAHKLIKSYLKLVAKIALSYKHYNVPVVDLISEGNLGLLKAVRKYNPDLGYRLSTYAMWWIKAMIQDYVLKSWSLVRVITTAQQKKLFFALRKIKRQIASTHISISAEEYEKIANDLNMPASEVQQFHHRLSSPDVSLNQPSKSEDSDSVALIEFVPEPRPNQELMLVTRQESQIKRDLATRAIASLDPRERYILETRRLLNEPETLQALSDKLKISKERVRQIENQAMSKLREFVRIHGAGLLDLTPSEQTLAGKRSI